MCCCYIYVVIATNDKTLRGLQTHFFYFTTHTEKSVLNLDKLNLIWIVRSHNFPIDLAPNGIPFSYNSIGKV